MNVITQSEVADLMQCPTKWGFGYGDLAGFPLRPKAPALRLREGRAWGAAVQAWHSGRAIDEAHAVLVQSLADDHAYMASHGVGNAEEMHEALERMKEMLVHYCATQPRLNLIGSEVELEMPHGDGFTYRCHLDGIHQDEDGFLWVVEFKLRSPGAFTSLEVVQLWRQVRWYALALEDHCLYRRYKPLASDGAAGARAGDPIVRGVIVDERLNDAPKAVRYNKADRFGRSAVSATQSCTYEDYERACMLNNQEMHPPTVERLKAKVWQQRHEVFFRPDELHDALLELESSAELLRLYRSHRLRPVRNPGRLCTGCAFLSICPDPTDERLRDALYQDARIRAEEAKA